MPNKFERPSKPSDALYHDVLCGNIANVQAAISETPELINGTVVAGAWSHGGRRCGPEDDVIACLQLLVNAGADFSGLEPGTYDSAFKAFPRAAMFLFDHGADASKADGDGKTGLHCVVEVGNRDAAAFLLERGADVNAKTKTGETPRDIATRLRLPALFEFLREHGGRGNLLETGHSSFSVPERNVEAREGSFWGEVAWYRSDRGYGYLRDGTGDAQQVHGDLFFDRDDIVGDEPMSIEQGTQVSFRVTDDKFGSKAAEVDFGIDVNAPSSPGVTTTGEVLFQDSFEGATPSDNWIPDTAIQVENGTLKFAPLKRWGIHLVTKRNDFADFVMSADAYEGHVAVIVRWVNHQHYYMISMSDQGEVVYHRFSPEHGMMQRDFLPMPFVPEKGKWYRMAIRVEGFGITAALGEMGGPLQPCARWDDKHQSFSTGAIGFWQHQRSRCQYRDLKVTSVE